MKKKDVNVTIAGPVSTGKSSLMFLFKDFLKEKGIEFTMEGDLDFPTEIDLDAHFHKRDIGKNNENISKYLKDKIKVNFKIIQTVREPMVK